MEILATIAHEAAAASCLLDSRGDVSVIVNRGIVFEIFLQVLFSVCSDVVSIVILVTLVGSENLVAVICILTHHLMMLGRHLVKCV